VINQADFGSKPCIAGHDLQEAELFTDEALIDLLDHFPRQNLHALSMGSDPARIENRLAIHDGVSGADLLRAVRKGRLWLNATRVNLADQRYQMLIEQLYAQICRQVPGFSPDFCQGSLLISSPHALVYYHVDAPASFLWHIRGRKRVWIYPALDERFIKREHLEDIFAGVRHEYLPYESAYDHSAVIYDLEPGQWVSWPQNAPHRVTNMDSMNVSLTTEHFTRQSRRRVRVYTANRFLRLRFGLHGLSVREDGAASHVKSIIHRVAKFAGVEKLKIKQHIPTMRIDAAAPAGVVDLHDINSARE
jgi:hypothetical protein